MSRKVKKRKDDYAGDEETMEKPSKEEVKVAKWLRSNVPVKKTKFLNHNVEYFSSIKALDALMASKFAQGDSCLFPTRQHAIDFMNTMLYHKFFHRAKKVPVSEQELKGRTKAKDGSTKETSGKDKESKKETKSKEEKNTDAESSHAEGKLEKKDDKEKRKRKIRLEMHPQQLFVDGHEAYVWIFDPIPMSYWIFGTLLVIGAIVICLFPLWPPTLRKGVYYLSIAAAGFLVFLLGLVVIRFMLFCLIWICTGGKHHFWFLPNLTEDVGFVASFIPLYKHEYRDGSESDKSKKSKKKKKVDKDSDAEEEQKPLLEKDETENVGPENNDESEETVLRQRKMEKSPKKDKIKAQQDKSPKPEENFERQSSITPSESESESSQRSSTGKDFEMVDADDVDTSS
jgi:translocation protein SEC62